MVFVHDICAYTGTFSYWLLYMNQVPEKIY